MIRNTVGSNWENSRSRSRFDSGLKQRWWRKREVVAATLGLGDSGGGTFVNDIDEGGGRRREEQG